MKKLAFIIAVAGLALTACEKDDLSPNGDDSTSRRADLVGYWKIDRYVEYYYRNDSLIETDIEESNNGLTFADNNDFYGMDDSTKTDTFFMGTWEYLREDLILIGNENYKVSGLGTDGLDLSQEDVGGNERYVNVIELSR